MKKRLARKLTLKKETLGRLEAFQLKNVEGGSNWNSCNPISAIRCPSEGCTDTCTGACPTDAYCSLCGC